MHKDNDGDDKTGEATEDSEAEKDDSQENKNGLKEEEKEEGEEGEEGTADTDEAHVPLEPGQCLHRAKAVVLNDREMVSECSVREEEPLNPCCQCICDQGVLRESCSKSCREP